MSGSLGVNPTFKLSVIHSFHDRELTTSHGTYLVNIKVKGRPRREGTGSCLPRPPSQVGTSALAILGAYSGHWPVIDSTLPRPESRNLRMYPNTVMGCTPPHSMFNTVISHPLSCPLPENPQASWTPFPVEDTDVQSREGRSLALLLCPPLALFFLFLISRPRLCPKKEPKAQKGTFSLLSGTAQKR